MTHILGSNELESLSLVIVFSCRDSCGVVSYAPSAPTDGIPSLSTPWLLVI